MSKVTCWNPNCPTPKREIRHSERTRTIHCVTCAKGSSYEPITCKSCSKKQFDTFGKAHEFYFVPIHAPTSMDFYCKECYKIVREKEERTPLFGLKKCQSSRHQSKDDDKQTKTSKLDSKIRCTVCENQVLKEHLHNLALKKELEKKKTCCQSSLHQKCDDDKDVDSSPQDGKNRCIVCELKYTQIMLKTEKLKQQNEKLKKRF